MQMTRVPSAARCCARAGTRVALALTCLVVCAPAVISAGAQISPVGAPDSLVSRRDAASEGTRIAISEMVATEAEPRAASRFRSAADSAEWEMARAAAERATGFRIVVSLLDRRLWAMSGQDTLLDAPIAVATGDSLAYAGRVWRFETPRGQRTVRRKAVDAIWSPPDWHYAEVASAQGLRLATLHADRPVRLADGRRLVVRDNRAGVLDRYGRFAPLPLDEEIVFDGTVFIPPIGTENRRIRGELGRHLLDLGDGYLLHGTPYTYTIGDAATHGCVRLLDEDIAWLHANVPVGTSVFIY